MDARETASTLIMWRSKDEEQHSRGDNDGHDEDDSFHRLRLKGFDASLSPMPCERYPAHSVWPLSCICPQIRAKQYSTKRPNRKVNGPHATTSAGRIVVCH